MIDAPVYDMSGAYGWLDARTDEGQETLELLVEGHERLLRPAFDVARDQLLVAAWSDTRTMRGALAAIAAIIEAVDETSPIIGGRFS